MKIATKLSPKAQEILNIVRSTDGWISRSDIAVSMGKKQLNPHDFNLLEVLNSVGLIESELQPIPGNIATRWMYRAAKE